MSSQDAPCNNAETNGPEAVAWRCIIEGRSEVSDGGAAKHIEYRAQAAAEGRPPQAMQFRFSELVKLLDELSKVPELVDVRLPALPPKVTLRSVFFGRFEETVQETRCTQLQEFLEELFKVLGQKYAGVGDPADLCEPLGQFMQRSASRGTSREAEEIAAAVRAAEVVEDRHLVAQQDAEYEESLRRDREAEAERAAAAKLAAEAARKAEEEEEAARRKAEEEEQAAAACAEARLADLARRRSVFEEKYPPPAKDEPQASLRFRTPAGETMSRCFAASALVEVLFEFAAVADWKIIPADGFDLRTSFPVKSLSSDRERTLKDAGLTPSAALLIAEPDD
eukprot:TRINITY_DN31147_c0_g1_i1.p1 TRINITY_DN31147_c0_g1~~TRINITY_DN31147_c0_g1_i1.p1  ORF type:complete len:338 (+),score=119.48 TRINITY_DN31147_c0_g1_i1:52-1065(+)